MAAQSKTRNVVGSNATRGMNVCVYSVFVLPCVGSGLATGWSPVQGVLPTVCKIHISELTNSGWAQARAPNPSGKRKKMTRKEEAETQDFLPPHSQFVSGLNGEVKGNIGSVGSGQRTSILQPPPSAFILSPTQSQCTFFRSYPYYHIWYSCGRQQNLDRLRKVMNYCLDNQYPNPCQPLQNTQLITFHYHRQHTSQIKY
jgi:hypothetical protein